MNTILSAISIVNYTQLYFCMQKHTQPLTLLFIVVNLAFKQCMQYWASLSGTHTAACSVAGSLPPTIWSNKLRNVKTHARILDYNVKASTRRILCSFNSILHTYHSTVCDKITYCSLKFISSHSLQCTKHVMYMYHQTLKVCQS